MPENHAYFVRGDDGEEYGPVGLAELREWVGENRVGLGTQVRLDGPGELWQAWQYYPELVALLAEMRATGLAVGPVLAPVGRRILAGVLDLVLNLVLIMPLILVFYFFLPGDLLIRLFQYSQLILQGTSPLPQPPQIPFWFQAGYDAIFLGVGMLYYTGFHALHGHTPAKAVTRLRVVDAQGRKPPFLKVLLRALVFVVSVYVFYGIPLFYILLNPQRRALHDLVAGTYVVEM
jgi:uncharacterized RDD family membrane protein YckC